MKFKHRQNIIEGKSLLDNTQESDIVVGLFGTCGNDPWREPFMKQYDKQGVKYFNPDVGDDWHPGMVDEENKHMLEDDIILFPVLGSSLGTGSLGEIGFSIMNVTRNITQKGGLQSLVVCIEDEVSNTEKFSADERLNSKNNRAIIKSKLKDINHASVYLVDSMKEMQKLTDQLIELHNMQSNISDKYGSKSA